MTYKEIQELIKLVSKSNLAEFKYKKDDLELTIRTALYSETKAASVVSAPPAVMPATAPVTSAPPSPAAPSTAPAAEPEKPSETPAQREAAGKKHLEIKSPMVGTFYRSSSPEKSPYVEIGQKIKKGDVVCIIEAMKLFNEIESEISGTIVKALVENAQPVEYDQVLFLVEPE